MVKQIITIAMGVTGCIFSDQYWSNVNWEMGLDPSGRVLASKSTATYGATSICGVLGNPNWSSVYTESRDGCLKPRALYASQPLWDSQDVFCWEKKGELEEKLRMEVEKCDGLSVFQCIGSVGDGCLRGHGGLLMKEIRNEYSKQLLQCVAQISPRNKSSAHDEIGDVAHLYRYTNETILLESNGLSKTSEELFGSNKYSHVVAAEILCNLSSGNRLPTSESTCLADIQRNLAVPGFKFIYANLYGTQTLNTPSAKKVYLCNIETALSHSDDNSGLSLRSYSIMRGFRPRKSNRMRLVNTHSSPFHISFSGGKNKTIASSFVHLSLHTRFGVNLQNRIETVKQMNVSSNSQKSSRDQTGVHLCKTMSKLYSICTNSRHHTDAVSRPMCFSQSDNDEVPPEFDGLVVCLDIDKTLCYCDTSGRGGNLKSSFTMQSRSQSYAVFPRPHAQMLFEFLAMHPRVYLTIWTAARKDYAQCVLANIFGEWLPNVRLFFHRVQYSSCGGKKDLRMMASCLNVSMDRILMVDDNPSVFASSWIKQKIVRLVHPFDQPCRQRRDRALLDVKKEIEARLALV